MSEEYGLLIFRNMMVQGSPWPLNGVIGNKFNTSLKPSYVVFHHLTPTQEKLFLTPVSQLKTWIEA